MKPLPILVGVAAGVFVGKLVWGTRSAQLKIVAPVHEVLSRGQAFFHAA